jgi:predicted permease
MEIANLVLPVFAVIVTGWLAGTLGYISQSLADGLIHFAYNVAMPALLLVTIAQEPARNLLQWRFLLAFGGGSIMCFALVFLAVRVGWGRDCRRSSTGCVWCWVSIRFTTSCSAQLKDARWLKVFPGGTSLSHGCCNRCNMRKPSPQGGEEAWHQTSPAVGCVFS